MTFDKNLRAAAHRLLRQDGSAGLSPTLRDRMLAALPGEPSRATPSSFSPVRRAIVVCVMASVTGIGLISLERHVGSGAPRSLPSAAARHVETPVDREKARVLAAVDRQNTWHLSGTFRYVKPAALSQFDSRWEEWGRHSPFFYRQDRDGETMIDDGKTVIHIIPPKQWGIRRAGRVASLTVPGRIVIRRSAGPRFITADTSGLLASDPLRTRFSPVYSGTMSVAQTANGIGRSERLRFTASPDPRGSDTETIEMLDETKGIRNSPGQRYIRQLEENRSSHLPSAYSSVWIDDNANQAAGKDNPNQIETIQAVYNCALSAAITKSPHLPGYTTIDLRAIDTSGSLKTPAAGPRLGMRPEMLNQDKTGIHAVRLNVNLDGIAGIKDIVHLNLENFTAKDDAGNEQVCAEARTTDPLAQSLLIAPADPDKAKGTHPTRFVIHCDAIVAGYDTGTLHLPPGPETRIHLVAELATGSKTGHSEIGNDFAITDLKAPPCSPLETISVKRAFYYAAGKRVNVVSGPPAGDFASVGKSIPVTGIGLRPMESRAPLDPADAARASYWWSVAADEANRLGERGTARQYQYLSQLYR